jgi:gamma-glutamyltranspeptidase / glutathione hydrolase
VERPRFGSASYPRSSEPHALDPERLYLEGRFGSDVCEGLARRGHVVSAWEDWDWVSGGVCAVVRHVASGVLEGAADPRRPTGIAGR